MELQAVHTKLNAQRQLLTAKRQRVAEQVVEQEKLDRLREHLNSSEAQFFSPSESRDFFAGLDALAGSANCQLVEIDFVSREESLARTKQEHAAQSPTNAQEKEHAANIEAAQKTRRLTKISARLSLLGTYAEIIKLLEEIEVHPQIVHVSGLTLALVSQDASELNASFVLTIFVLEGEKEEV